MLNEDYKDILRALSDEDAEFLLVGAYAMASHGYPRSTMDIEIWVMPSPANADRVLGALARFGAPLLDLSREDLMKAGTVFQIGVAPCRIDILTGLDGLVFADARARAFLKDIDGITVPVLCVDDLITNKKAVGRTRDLADVEALDALRDAPPR